MRSSVGVLDFTRDDLPAVSGVVSRFFEHPNATPEPGAQAHWVFDKAGPKGLLDLVSDYTLSSQSGAVRYRGESLVIPAASGNALVSELEGYSGTTLFAVARKLYTGRVARLFGYPGANPNDGGMRAQELEDTLWTYQGVNPAIPSEQRVGSTRFEAVPVGAWYFVAAYQGPLSGSEQIAIFMGPDSYNSAPLDSPPIYSGADISIGSVSGTAYAGDLEFAEFGIVRGQPLTLALGQAMFARSKNRMSQRGISLG